MAPTLFIFLATLFVLQGAESCGPVVPYDTPFCSVFSRELGYELRAYPAGQYRIEMDFPGATYETAASVGFLRLAAYLNGDNAENMQIPMAFPFMVRPNASGYTVGLFISSRIVNPPTPTDRDMRIRRSIRSYQAVIGPFPGPVINETNFLHNMRQLVRFLERDRIEYNNQTFTYLGYSSPLTMFRQQEVQVQVHLGDA